MRRISCIWSYHCYKELSLLQFAPTIATRQNNIKTFVYFENSVHFNRFEYTIVFKIELQDLYFRMVSVLERCLFWNDVRIVNLRVLN